MLNKVDDSTLYEKIVWQIKNLIAKGVYKKGTMLPSEKEIMEMTGVSRITVREALSILAQVGIIETRKGKGSFVIVDSDDKIISELFIQNIGEYVKNFAYSSNIRLMIEPEIAKRAAMKASPKDIEALSKILKESKQTPNNFEAFHRRILTIVDSSALLAFFDSLDALEHTPPKIAMASPIEDNRKIISTIEEHHYKILEAIANKNAEFAYFYMKEHLTFIIKEFEEYFNCFFNN